MKLKYPLDFYDDAGRLKPSFLSYAFLLFACRGLIVLIVSLSLGQDGEKLLSVFYPETYHFYLALTPIIPALFSLILISKRKAIWESGKAFLFNLLIIMSCIALVIDILVQIYILNQLRFEFSVTHGGSILIALTGLLYYLRSKRTKDMLKDWKNT